MLPVLQQDHRVVFTIPAIANMGSPGVYKIAQQLGVCGLLFIQGSEEAAAPLSHHLHCTDDILIGQINQQPNNCMCDLCVLRCTLCTAITGWPIIRDQHVNSPALNKHVLSQLLLS